MLVVEFILIRTHVSFVTFQLASFQALFKCLIGIKYTLHFVKVVGPHTVWQQPQPNNCSHVYIMLQCQKYVWWPTFPASMKTATNPAPTIPAIDIYIIDPLFHFSCGTYKQSTVFQNRTHTCSASLTEGTQTTLNKASTKPLFSCHTELSNMCWPHARFEVTKECMQVQSKPGMKCPGSTSAAVITDALSLQEQRQRLPQKVKTVCSVQFTIFEFDPPRRLRQYSATGVGVGAVVTPGVKNYGELNGAGRNVSIRP